MGAWYAYFWKLLFLMLSGWSSQSTQGVLKICVNYFLPSPRACWISWPHMEEHRITPSMVSIMPGISQSPPNSLTIAHPLQLRPQLSSLPTRQRALAYPTLLDLNRPHLLTHLPLPPMQLPRLPGPLLNPHYARPKHNSSLPLLAAHRRTHDRHDDVLRILLHDLQRLRREMVQDR